ncbi:hypothetical protein GB937_001905 [Aspergillus fischeri]|nr:hypothetical protein GB937_001905 [Aspergillus fischeri]
MPAKGSSIPKPNASNASSERPMENEEWKQRPPYLIQPPEEFGPVKWQAKCQCGQVTYKISREKPLKAKYCHCRGCQVMHGAPFQWAAIFHKSDLTFDKGAHGLSFYSSAHSTREYEVPTKVSCSFCRTPIMDEGRNVCLIFPEAIVAGDSDEERQKWREAFAPDCHIFYDKRCIEILDGKTKWSGMDEESDLVDDYARLAAAVTQITDNEMSNLLSQGGVELADRYAPLWFFGQAQNQPPCYPTWAFGGSPTSSDIYDDAHKTPAAPQCDYPNVGCRCRNPGVGIGNRGPAFPIYFTYKRCSDTEVRVVYNLFYEKDGAEVIGIDTGHDYDWERVIIIHSRDANNMWAPSRALLSAHSGYHDLAWGDIQNTLTTDEINAGDAKNPNGVRNNDHPKVYVAWSKHAHFDDRNTGWNDPISQSTDNAFRSDDWWYYVDKSYYILSDNTTAAGKALGSANWGDATSNPPSVHSSVCSAP